MIAERTFSDIFFIGVILQVFGWGFQVVVGHGYFEGTNIFDGT
jgi:hypothetical protein